MEWNEIVRNQPLFWIYAELIFIITTLFSLARAIVPEVYH